MQEIYLDQALRKHPSSSSVDQNVFSTGGVVGVHDRREPTKLSVDEKPMDTKNKRRLSSPALHFVARGDTAVSRIPTGWRGGSQQPGGTLARGEIMTEILHELLCFLLREIIYEQ